MINQSIPATREFSSRKELDLFVANQLVPVVVAILPDGESGEFWESYFELANIARKIPLVFRHSSQMHLSKGLGLSQVRGGVAIMRPTRYSFLHVPLFVIKNLHYLLGSNQSMRKM